MQQHFIKVFISISQIMNNNENLFLKNLLLFKYSCLHFPPTTALHPTHPHLPPSNLPPLALSMCPSYVFLDGSSHTSPSYPPPPLSLVSISQFFISMSLVVFCLLVCFADQVPLIGEIIWYLSFTSWLISLSIMPSHFIHAVMKGRRSFFLSAVYSSIV